MTNHEAKPPTLSKPGQSAHFKSTEAAEESEAQPKAKPPNPLRRVIGVLGKLLRAATHSPTNPVLERARVE